MEFNLKSKVKVTKVTINFESERLSGCSAQIEGEVIQIKKISYVPDPVPIKTLVTKPLDIKILKAITDLLEKEMCLELE